MIWRIETESAKGKKAKYHQYFLLVDSGAYWGKRESSTVLVRSVSLVCDCLILYLIYVDDDVILVGS
jgi:hypothetical protein